MLTEERNALIEAARTIADERLVVGTTGNVSLRIGEQVLITPTRLPYAEMSPEDLVLVGISGEPRKGGRLRPSRELPLHLEVYRRRPDLAALVHTHSPHATAWSFLGEVLSPELEESRYYETGAVRTSPAGPAGSSRLAEAAAATLGDSNAVLLGGHGVLAAGTDLRRAVDVARAVEHQAQVALLLRAIGDRLA